MFQFIRERAEQRVKDIEAAVYRDKLPLGPWTWEKDGEDLQEARLGFRWTDAEAASWLRLPDPIVVPDAWAGERVALYLDIPGVEPLLFLDGAPTQALDYNHQDVLLHDSAQGGERHRVEIECYAPSRGGTGEIRAADLVRVDRDAYMLYYDFQVALQLLGVLPEESREGQGVRAALDAAMNALDYTRGRHADAFYASLPGAIAALREQLYDKFPGDAVRDPRMVCAGHSHLDLAYLWAVPNTRKKVGRTFASALRLMDEYGEYHFTHTQPQAYAWAKEHYPDLYARVQERVAEGRWEPTGGMWVEADCNVTGGESLIRQILHGNRFFEREFGIKSRVLWLPDVFGYSAALPQIVKGCGMDYFMTTKISWNQTNRFPHDTFFWRGIDSTDLLTHLVTTPGYHAQLQQHYYTYNGEITADKVKGAWNEYRGKAANPDELLFLFGWGDGGGGPTRHMIEAGRRLASVAGVPRCTFDNAEPFFDRLHERIAGNPRTPRWVGELYLENHRGTYTSQGRIKRANRKNEILLRNAEVFSALASVEAGAAYPQAELTKAWETLLLNQFHDILPGTCIPSAVAESLGDHAAVTQAAGAALHTALDNLVAGIGTRDNAVVVFNPTDTLRPAEVAHVTVPANLVRKGALEFADTDGAPLLSQFLGTNGTENRYLVLVNDVGGLGYQTLSVGKAGGAPEGSNLKAQVALTPGPSPRLGRGEEDKDRATAEALAVSGTPLPSLGEGPGVRATLENDLVRVTFDDAGEIVSFVHRIFDDEEDPDRFTEREIIPPGQTGNALVLYEDKPYAYDGWNIDPYYEDKPYPLREVGTVESMRMVENGPVRAGIEITRRFFDSTLTQRVYLHAHSPRLTFETDVDWQERQMLLKAEFPVAVHAERATYEIQFGNVERPTHRNTSWDAARFEVCAHKWADLSEGDYGVSLLNDCKYGHDCHENVLRLTLLKAGTHPDPEADRGPNTFTYALLPHTGDWRGETVDEAYALNYPLLTRFAPANPKGTLPASYEFATVNDQGIVIEAIKQAEDGDGIIIRLYEAFNTRGTATLTVGFALAEAFAVSLVEADPAPLEHGENTVTFDYRPFEIKTFLLRP
jgi:alpha-mannosidase